MTIHINYLPFFVLLISLAMSLFSTNAVSQLPTSPTGAGVAPDEWLFDSIGLPWWHRTEPSLTPRKLKTSEPSPEEQKVIDKANAIAKTAPLRAIALLDGDRIVFKHYNSPASDFSTVMGFSLGKTVTSLAVGQAICQGKISMDTKAEEMLPRLLGKDLGAAKVRDLLKMASGVFEGNPDSTIMTAAQRAAWVQGELDLSALISEDRNTAAKRGFISNYKPGEIFAYKSTDPIVLALMISKATGIPWSLWVQQSVLNPMGAAFGGFYMQDKKLNGLADSGLRVRFEDWLRFAIWVKEQSLQPGCFGNFVREALTLQIRNSGTVESRKTGKLFGGYGYFVWTDNEIAKDAAFASGWGGQRIGWNTKADNHRVVVVISNIESWMPELYALVRDWHQIPSKLR
jgi:CubicO group peptidase (beta-lactamase class C family)